MIKYSVIPDLYIRTAALILFFLPVPYSYLLAQPYSEIQNAPHITYDPVLVKEYILEGKGVVSVFTISGDIDVVSVPNTQTVRIELYADRGFSFWSFGNPLENYRITSIKRGNEISTSVEPKSKQRSSMWSSHTAFSYKITVPECVSTNLKTLNGSVSIRNLDGDHMLKSNAGDIEAEDVHGMVKAYASAGDIHADNIRGTVYARADGGNVYAKRVEGEIRLKVNGGKVVSSDLSGSMIAVVNAGEIEARFDRVHDGIDLQTNLGDIHLIVPEASGYNLYARGSHVLFDENGLFKGTFSDELADGAINGGGMPLNLTANAGRVTIQFKK